MNERDLRALDAEIAVLLAGDGTRNAGELAQEAVKELRLLRERMTVINGFAGVLREARRYKPAQVVGIQRLSGGER